MTEKPHYVINDFELFDSEGHLAWERNRDLWPTANREAALLIELDVDGEFTSISADLGQSAEVEVVRRVVVELQRLLAAFDDVYPEHMRWPGRCMVQGDTGRCGSSTGHADEHNFPTEAQMEASLRLQIAQPVARAVGQQSAGTR